MTNHEFDRLLETACARENQAETAAAGLTDRCSSRLLRTAVIAAVCAALLALGVAAAWPRLELARTGALTFSLQVEADSGSASQVERIEFSRLPEGYAIAERCSDPDGAWDSVVLSGPDPQGELAVWKYALGYDIAYMVTRVDGSVPEDLDAVELIMGEYVVLDGVQDLSREALEKGSVVVYPTEDCYYVASYCRFDLGDVCRILQGMK